MLLLSRIQLHKKVPIGYGEFIHVLSGEPYQPPYRSSVEQTSTSGTTAVKVGEKMARASQRKKYMWMHEDNPWVSPAQTDMKIHKTNQQTERPWRPEPALNTIVLCLWQQSWRPVLVELQLVIVGSGNPAEQEAEPAEPVLASK